MIRKVGLLVIVLLSGCGGSNKSEPTDKIQETTETIIGNTDKSKLEIPTNHHLSTYKIALIGNSHSHGVRNTLKQVVSYYSPQSTVELKVLGTGYTEELIKDKNLLNELSTGNWTHLIIQGQKYSQSGNYTYSTKETEQFISLAKSENIMPILFPEHPQRGDKLEGERVYELHREIAKNESSCVAPIGLAWNHATEQLGVEHFYNTDGNHAGTFGFMLTSLVLTEIITGEVVDNGKKSLIDDIPADVQAVLSQIASQTIQDNSPCQ